MNKLAILIASAAVILLAGCTGGSSARARL